MRLFSIKLHDVRVYKYTCKYERKSSQMDKKKEKKGFCIK